MLMILLISGVIIPAFMWCYLYFNITDQYIVDDDGEVNMTETKEEAQRYVRRQTIRHPLFWAYMIYSLCIITAAVFSINVAGIGDWYFSI